MARPSKRKSDTATGTPKSRAGKLPSSGSRRSSARIKSTPTKSPYFKKTANDADELSSPYPSPSAAEDSGWEDQEQSESEALSEGEVEASEEESEDFSEEEEERPKKRQKKRSGGQTKTTSTTSPAVTAKSSSSAKGQELWRPGVKAGLGAGKRVVIDLPKAREAGKTPYKDETIHQNTMLFLSELAENNDREWLKMHDADYRTSWKDFVAFLEGLQPLLIDVDETIPELPTKDIIFRIYRDVRFTNDPTPYKAHFSAAWSRTGRKGPYSHYYIHIQPGNSFVGGGLWCPEASALAAVRRDIDRSPQSIKKVLVEPSFRKNFLGGITGNDKDKLTAKAVKEFVAHNGEHALKTKPKGYDAEHPDIGMLRLKSFTVGKKLTDEEVLAPNASKHVAEIMKAMMPFITYLNDVVMPDPANAGGDSEREEEDDE